MRIDHYEIADVLAPLNDDIWNNVYVVKQVTDYTSFTNTSYACMYSDVYGPSNLLACIDFIEEYGPFSNVEYEFLNDRVKIFCTNEDNKEYCFAISVEN